MLNQRRIEKTEITTAVTQLLILLGLCVWMFWPELADMAAMAIKSSEAVHSLVAPVVILLLVYCRRDALMKSEMKGSAWGIVLLLSGLMLYAGTAWPFNYGYARDLAVLPALAGVVLVACGGRALKLSLPMLLIVMLAIPISSRFYARLIIRPETYTITAVAAVLGRLPGVDTWVKGTDVFFTSAGNSGVIGLGESNRGASLLLAFAMVGVFVVFSKRRSFGRLAVAAVTAIPIILFCNFLRFLCWGPMVIYAKLDPVSSLMRNCSAIYSLLVSYSLFVLVSDFSINLFVEIDEEQKVADNQEDTNVGG